MKAAFIEKPGTIAVRTVADPVPGPGELLIRVESSGICGTDVHIFKGEYLGSYPIIPGHEFSGTVIGTGPGVQRFKPGDRIAAEPNIPCNNCGPCLNNRQNFCENWKAVGVTLPGGMAELVAVPESAAFGIGDLSFDEGAFVEPLSCVLHGVERVGFRLGDRVLIIGAGPIGLLLSQSIQLQGASEIVQVDKNHTRLALAKTLGAARVESTLDAVGDKDFDVVVDATGVPALMEKTLAFARPGGKILLFGVPPAHATVTFPAFPIFRQGLTILSSFTSVRNSIQAVRLLGSGNIDVRSLVSHRLPLSGLADGIALLEQGKEGVLKVLIKPEA